MQSSSFAATEKASEMYQQNRDILCEHDNRWLRRPGPWPGAEAVTSGASHDGRPRLNKADQAGPESSGPNGPGFGVRSQYRIGKPLLSDF